MSPNSTDIACKGYAVMADVYEGSPDGPVLLSLIGRTSRRSKQRYRDFFPRLASELGITSVIFDYSGHGDSPFDIEELSQAQHFLEVITVFDWLQKHYPNRKTFVIGSSYGGYLAAQLTEYRTLDHLILRAPAIYRPQNFYTLKKEEDTDATQQFRVNKEALASHPLLARAARFQGKTLLVVHEHDEQIPKETTDAYADAFKAQVITEPVTHSLDDATPEQIEHYNESIRNWLVKAVNEETR